MNWQRLSHIGDIMAIPLFGLGIYYFYNKKNKNMIEWILLYFMIMGLLFDVYFSYNYILFG
jgi:hypothetical protein